MADNLLQGLQAAANATSQAGVSFLLHVTIFLLNRSVGVGTSYSNGVVHRLYIVINIILINFFWPITIGLAIF